MKPEELRAIVEEAKKLGLRRLRTPDGLELEFEAPPPAPKPARALGRGRRMPSAQELLLWSTDESLPCENERLSEQEYAAAIRELGGIPAPHPGKAPGPGEAH